MNLDIPMTFQKPEIAYEIELRRTGFQPSQPDHFGEVAVAVAPVQREDRRSGPGAGRESVPLVRGQLVERYRADAFALHDHFGCGRQLWILCGRIRVGSCVLMRSK